MNYPNHGTTLLDRLRLSSAIVLGLILYLSTHGYIPFLMSLNATGADQEETAGLAAQGLFLLVVAFLVFPYTTRVIRAARLAKPILAIAALAVVSSAWSQDPALTLRRSVMLLGPTVFALFLHVAYEGREQLELLVLAGIIMAALSIAIAVRYPAVGLDPTMADGSWQGIFPQKNVCARACVFFLLPVMAFLGRSAGKTLLALTALPLLAALLFKTNSKTGWVLAAVAVLSMLALRLLRRLRSNEAAVLALATIAVTIAALLLLESQFSSVVQLLGKDSTLTGRTAIWNGVVEAITKHPLLGYGYAAFWLGLRGESANVVLSARWVVPAAHDGFLDIWLQLGAVGLGLFLLSLIQGCRAAVWCLRNVGWEAVEWAAGVMWMTVLYNLDETSLMIPRELLWVLYCLAYLNLRALMLQTKSRPATRVQVVAMSYAAEVSV